MKILHNRGRDERSKGRVDTSKAMLAALDRSQAVIEFSLDGEILAANENFCSTLGYAIDEIRGKHHSMFVDEAYRRSSEYEAFWHDLRQGKFQAAKYKRIGKGGREIWIQASYNPIMDASGKPFGVVKFATDVTEAENERKIVFSIGAGLKQAAEGNLTVRLNTPFPSDYEMLRSDFNDAMSKLQSAMAAIANSADGINTEAAEISDAADALSRRTEQQAASLEQTAAALDEITATVRKSAEGALEVNKVVASARKDGETSGEVVNRAVSAMSEIERSSQKISQIIGVIDEIAFQTNLLALNAGVEAARAGEAGRGFAVVASEVRALAQRSADAAKEIKTLISESSRQVESGVDLVGQAGDSLVRILQQIARISQLVSEISTSSQEQSSGLSQVNTAVNQMDQVTQQNAAMVEKSTAASKSLASESSELAALVGEFNVGEQAASGSSRSRPASHAEVVKIRPSSAHTSAARQRKAM
jgi:methyl-accepting chemotaxis protein